MNGVPLLWHLKVSNFNEKARWALDYKRVPHTRKAAIPGQHTKVAQRLTGTNTFPILVVDGRPIGDSTLIIEDLERRVPEPPLYPADPDERRRALQLEEFFDEEYGPYLRLLVVHHMLPSSEVLLGAFFPDMNGAQRLAARAAYPLVKWRFNSTLSITPARVDEAFAKVREAGRVFQSEIGPSGYLVGDRFSVADLTAAALAGPAVAPEQFPYPQPQRDHSLLAPLRDVLAESGLLDWTREMYARHRGTSAEVPREAAAAS